MQRVLLLVVLLAAVSIAAAPLARVTGQVTIDGHPLPGCVVQLKSAAMTRMAVSDANGRYAFPGVVQGEYEIHFELDGVEPAQRRVVVQGETVAVPAVDLRLIVAAQSITIVTCGADQPADTFGEDWNELMSHAEIAVRFPHQDNQLSPEYLQWCAVRGIAPEQHWSRAYRALEIAAADPRSHSLLLQALATNDSLLVAAAITGLGEQRDFDSLPLIERAIARMPDPGMLATYLAHFADERADAVAKKFEGQFYGNVYEEWRSRAGAMHRERRPSP